MCANLSGDVPAEISWCREALGRSPDAVNLWIGNNRSAISIHSGSTASVCILFYLFYGYLMITQQIPTRTHITSQEDARYSYSFRPQKAGA